MISKETSESRNTPKDQYLDLRGLSVYSSLSVPTIRDYIRKSALPHFKLSGKILIRKSEFDRWIESFRGKTEQEIEGIVDAVMSELKG